MPPGRAGARVRQEPQVKDLSRSQKFSLQEKYAFNAVFKKIKIKAQKSMMNKIPTFYIEAEPVLFPDTRKMRSIHSLLISQRPGVETTCRETIITAFYFRIKCDKHRS